MLGDVKYVLFVLRLIGLWNYTMLFEWVLFYHFKGEKIKAPIGRIIIKTPTICT